LTNKPKTENRRPKTAPLRVAYLLLWFPEPSQTFVLDEVNTLARLGVEISVYTLYGSRPARRLAGLAPGAAPVSHLGLGSLAKLLRDLVRLRRDRGPAAGEFLRQVLVRRWRTWETAGEALWAALAGVHLAGVLKRAGIRHLHAPWADGPATAAWVASHFSGIPFSFSARAYDLHPPDGALEEKIAAATFVRTNTRANLKYLAELAPGSSAKLVNIYNGVSLAPAPRTARPEGPPFQLLALGRLVPKKGFPVLLEACRLLLAGGLDFRLTLGGDGPERPKLQALVVQYGLQDRVALPGFIPHREVPGWLARSHLLVMPSVIAPSGDRDGIPNVVLEALSQEVPVVASAVSGLPEVILPGETGWLAPSGDHAALAEAMAAALSDPAEARRRARAGRKLVQREFDSRRNYGLLKTWFEGADRGQGLGVRG
jgi:colanic acid/amylovoran biosynthesis glycosyltransferase